MNESIPVEKTLVVGLNRWKILTAISLALNALILILLLAAVIVHHHHGPQGPGGNFGGRGYGNGRGGAGCEMPFRQHRFAGMGMNRFERGPRGFEKGRGGFQVDREQGFRGRPGDFQRGQGGPENEGGGWGGHFSGGGFGSGPEQKTPPAPAEITDRIMEHLTGQLTLTDAEKTQVRPVIEQQVTQFQKDMETQRAAMKKMIDDTKNRIKPLLTGDQQKQLDAMPMPGEKPEDKAAGNPPSR